MSFTLYLHTVLWSIAAGLVLWGVLMRDRGDYDFFTPMLRLGAFAGALIFLLWGTREWWIA